MLRPSMLFVKESSKYYFLRYFVYFSFCFFNRIPWYIFSSNIMRKRQKQVKLWRKSVNFFDIPRTLQFSSVCYHKSVDVFVCGLHCNFRLNIVSSVCCKAICASVPVITYHECYRLCLNIVSCVLFILVYYDIALGHL